MRPGRPTPLAIIERDLMIQLPTARADNRTSTARMLDLALGVGIVNTADHARLDELRELRHDINYPEDLVTPSAADLESLRRRRRDLASAHQRSFVWDVVAEVDQTPAGFLVRED